MHTPYHMVGLSSPRALSKDSLTHLYVTKVLVVKLIGRGTDRKSATATLGPATFGAAAPIFGAQVMRLSGLGNLKKLGNRVQFAGT